MSPQVQTDSGGKMMKTIGVYREQQEVGVHTELNFNLEFDVFCLNKALVFSHVTQIWMTRLLWASPVVPECA